jgi:predicted O-methyltransferase YrrM
VTKTRDVPGLVPPPLPMAPQQPGYGPPTPVPIFQWEQEFTQLLDVYRELAPRRVLEVGSYFGGSLFHWLQNAPEGSTVVSVDSYAVGVDNRHLYSDWVPDGVTLQVIVGRSAAENTVVQAKAWAPYDFIFIDAGHYYTEVKADWEAYLPLAQKGAVVAFHDILPPTPVWPEIQVAQLWAEIKEDFETEEFVADRDADWGGIGVVRLP